MKASGMITLFRLPIICVVAVLLAPQIALAQFGGTQTVFDPEMFARQLQQVQQETAAATAMAQQLQYMVRNTTGGDAGLWQSNQGLLTNLGALISEQEGLSYTSQNVGQQFQQLYPGYSSTDVPGVRSPEVSTETTLNTLNGALESAQTQAQDFQAEQINLRALEARNQTAIGSLQAIQVSNEIALAQAQQIQMLRQLTMAMMNSQNVAAANQVNQRVQTDLEAQSILSAPVGHDVLTATEPAPTQP